MLCVLLVSVSSRYLFLPVAPASPRSAPFPALRPAAQYRTSAAASAPERIRAASDLAGFLGIAAVGACAARRARAGKAGRVSVSARTRAPVMRTTPTVRVEADPDAVGRALCDILVQEYEKSVAEKGCFSFAIAGGSMIKMLSYLGGESVVDWSKCTMGFVNHRCVPLDADGSTYHKARPAFLDSWMAAGLRVIAPTGTTDATKEADAYEAALRDALPSDADGQPIFDLCLIGAGIDGHVGSIYLNIPEVESRRPIVAGSVFRR